MMLVWQGDSYQLVQPQRTRTTGERSPLDPGASPKRLEKKPSHGEIARPRKAATDVNGDTLRMCMTDGAEYPTAFGSDADGLTMTVEIKTSGETRRR